MSYDKGEKALKVVLRGFLFIIPSVALYRWLCS